TRELSHRLRAGAPRAASLRREDDPIRKAPAVGMAQRQAEGIRRLLGPGGGWARDALLRALVPVRDVMGNPNNTLSPVAPARWLQVFEEEYLREFIPSGRS